MVEQWRFQMVSQVRRSEEVSPSDPENTFELPEAPDTLMFGAMEEQLRKALPAAAEDEPEDEEPFAEDEELDEEEDDDEPFAEEVPGDEEAAEEESAGRSVADWAEVLRKDGIQRLSEIPRKLHKEVLPLYVEAERRQVANDLGVVAQAQLIQLAKSLKWTYLLDEKFAEDPDLKLAFLESGRPDVGIYQQLKQMLATVDQQDDTTVRMQAEQSNQLVAMQRKQYDKLAAYPELQAEIERRYQAGNYPSNIGGLERLTDDVMELLEKGVEEKVARRTAPAKKQTADRQASADRRRSVPRPDVSRGRAAAGGDDLSRRTTNPNELIRMGITQQLEKIRR